MKKSYSFRRVCGGALLAALLGSSQLATAQQSALVCNGTSAYAQTTLTSLTGTAVSLECWVKVAAFKTASPYISGVIGMENGYDAAMLRFGDAGITADKLQFVLGVNGDHRKLTSTATFVANTWYHIAGTFDGTTMRLYVNGVLDSSLAMPGTALGTGTFRIGQDYDNTRVLSGTIDEVRVWTRTLTATEIAANACSVSATATGLAGYWKLNEGTGTTAADASTGSHPATLMGAATTSWTTSIPTSCATSLATRPGSAAPELQVQLLGNPAAGPEVDVYLSGLQGQPATVQLLNPLGAVVLEQALPAATTLRRTLALPAAAGLYVVRVSTPGGTASARLLRE